MLFPLKTFAFRCSLLSLFGFAVRSTRTRSHRTTRAKSPTRARTHSHGTVYTHILRIYRFALDRSARTPIQSSGTACWALKTVMRSSRSSGLRYLIPLLFLPHLLLPNYRSLDNTLDGLKLNDMIRHCTLFLFRTLSSLSHFSRSYNVFIVRRSTSFSLWESTGRCRVLNTKTVLWLAKTTCFLSNDRLIYYTSRLIVIGRNARSIDSVLSLVSKFSLVTNMRRAISMRLYFCRIRDFSHGILLWGDS